LANADELTDGAEEGAHWDEWVVGNANLAICKQFLRFPANQLAKSTMSVYIVLYLGVLLTRGDNNEGSYLTFVGWEFYFD